MAWDFETDQSFQRELDWMADFVRDEIEPLDLILGNPADRSDPGVRGLVSSLQQTVKARQLWACHLGPDLGGQGFGQLKLALMHEILGRSRWAPTIFGCQAPDSGNAEILARFGTEEQVNRYLRPLLDGEVSSSYSMTEPTGGSDPATFRTTARLDGEEWVLTGEKWFSTTLCYVSFFVVMAVTEPSEEPLRRMSMFIVPADLLGVEIVRNVGVGGESGHEPAHGLVHYNSVRLSGEHLLGSRGGGFVIAQTRLGGGRIHHAMRSVGQLNKALSMMLERAASREVRTGVLGSLQMVQERIADSWIELEQFRLLVLRTAWLIDKHNDYYKVRKDIAAVKAALPKVYHDVVQRALHLHGALGVSDEMPLVDMFVMSEVLAIVDGPTEVHKVTLAKQLLRSQTPHGGPWPSSHLPTVRQAAQLKVTAALLGGTT